MEEKWPLGWLSVLSGVCGETGRRQEAWPGPPLLPNQLNLPGLAPAPFISEPSYLVHDARAIGLSLWGMMQEVAQSSLSLVYISLQLSPRCSCTFTQGC